MGLKKIKKPNGEVYYIDETGHRIFSTNMDNLSETIAKNTPDEELQKKVMLTTETNPANINIGERIDIISAECVVKKIFFNPVKMTSTVERNQLKKFLKMPNTMC